MELWDLYDSERNHLNQTMVRGEKQPNGTYRLVIHACIFNSKGEMLIQQRQPFKSGWSNMWDVTVGGSAVSGDTSRHALFRELLEELGVRLPTEEVRPTLTVHFEWGFDDFYLINYEPALSTLDLQYEEVKAVKWASCEEILRMIDSGEFIPYQKSFVELLFHMKNGPDIRTREDTTVPQK